ncbi:MAG: elongation factor G [Pseudomonadota bacterium]|nr:elongation factor G [Pseudomonadota bacterium]
MPRYTTQDICNIALVGQHGCGKTSLTEAILYHTGTTNMAGKIESGNTVCDFDPLEKDYQHSLSAALVHFDYQNTHVNLIDTPGYPDFIGHTLSVFPAVETIAVVINAATGIEVMTQRLLERATRQKRCRMIIVNKIDTPEVDLAALVTEIKAQFGDECLPINLPAQQGNAVVDCFFNPQGESDLGAVAEAHTQIIDQVVEVDEALMEVYLEQGQELSPEQLHEPFEQALREGHLVPICFVSARTQVGIAELLTVLSRLMPNPLEGNPPPFVKGEEATPIFAQPDPEQHALAHVFKITADPFVGKLGVFRIHQGSMNKDSQLFIGDARKPFKVNHLFKLQGKQQVEIDQGIPGDLCTVAKVDALHLDAVLHDSHDEDLFHLKPFQFPAPMYGLAIKPKHQGDEQKVGLTLQKLEAEDPCLRVEHDASLNQTVLRGLGELHLRVTLEKMEKYYNVEVETQPPKIPYRETVSNLAEGHYRHKKQTGGAGQFGEVYLRVEPLARGAGFEFVNAVVGGAIPSVFIPAVEKGVRQVLENGAIAGYPLQDIKVTVYDGKHHPVDSKEVAFVAAGKKAFLEAIKKANPLVLEPMMKAEIVVPEASMGTITGDLSSKRARIQGTEMRAAQMVEVKTEVPLSELSNYQTQLKSSTGGQGSFSMEFSHYEAVPMMIQQQLMSEYQSPESDD